MAPDPATSPDVRGMARDMARFRRHRTRGFTLVELLVAMAITAILGIAIYSLFDSTSEAMYEADSLAQSVDSTRFAMEQIRADFKQAGAFGTPDSAWDPLVRPKPGDTIQLCDGAFQQDIGEYRAAGFVTYDGWQNYADQVMPSSVYDANEDGNLSAEFDGIVTIGAYDYPFMFEVGELEQSSAKVFDHPRGLDKIGRRNVFALEKPRTGFNSGGSSPLQTVDESTMENRIMRLRDPNGNYQFIGIDDLTEDGDDLRIAFTSFSGAESLFVKPSCAQDLKFGFPARTRGSGDERFYASLLDVYWYHVIRDPSNPDNFLLVRHRLDGWAVMQALSEWNKFEPEPHTVGEYTIIAERVADFQIWFDCTENKQGTIEELEWSAGWNPPDGTNQSTSEPHHGCLDPTSSGSSDDPKTVKARAAHVRLSVRTESERTDLQHNPFPDPGNLGDHTRLETFDIHPDQKGATRVYTTQADFELTNYAVRNLRP